MPLNTFDFIFLEGDWSPGISSLHAVIITMLFHACLNIHDKIFDRRTQNTGLEPPKKTERMISCFFLILDISWFVRSWTSDLQHICQMSSDAPSFTRTSYLGYSHKKAKDDSPSPLPPPPPQRLGRPRKK
jgi:hypothetical protein